MEYNRREVGASLQLRAMELTSLQLRAMEETNPQPRAMEKDKIRLEDNFRIVKAVQT